MLFFLVSTANMKKQIEKACRLLISLSYFELILIRSFSSISWCFQKDHFNRKTGECTTTLFSTACVFNFIFYSLLYTFLSLFALCFGFNRNPPEMIIIIIRYNKVKLNWKEMFIWSHWYYYWLLLLNKSIMMVFVCFNHHLE